MDDLGPTIAGRWTVVSIRAAGGAAPYLLGESTWPHPVTVEFRPDPGPRRLVRLRGAHGSFVGSTGCNSTVGAYRHAGEALGPRGTVSTTLVGSHGEPGLDRVLREMRRVTAVGDGGLVLLGGDRRVLAELRRAL